MTIHIPKLDFSLLVEISTNINDFSFMELHNVQVKNVGSNIKNPKGGKPTAVPSYDSSDEAPFNDRAVLDFGNLTVSEAVGEIVAKVHASLSVKFKESRLDLKFMYELIRCL